MIGSFKEIINRAPPKRRVKEIEQRLAASLTEIDYDHIELRVSKRGRDLYLLVHVVVSEEFDLESIEQLDDIRQSSEMIMRKWNPAIVMDILFIKDPALAG